MVKVKVTSKDNLHEEWKEPFVGELAGFIRSARGGPCAMIFDSSGNLHAVPTHLVKRLPDTNSEEEQ